MPRNLTALLCLCLLAGCSARENRLEPPAPLPSPTALVLVYAPEDLPATKTPFQPLPTGTPTPTPSPSPTPPPSPTPTTGPTRKAALPESAEISGISGQNQAYPLDCEARSAVDWAAFFGITIGEMEFQDALPVSDNPEEGYVGSYRDPPGYIPPNSYGVHAAPVARLLRAYGLPAEERKGMSLSELKAEIAAGRPVIVWIINAASPGAPVEYTARDGSKVRVAYFEHTVIAYGYTGQTILLLDGMYKKEISSASFEATWAVLGNMAVTARAK